MLHQRIFLIEVPSHIHHKEVTSGFALPDVDGDSSSHSSWHWISSRVGGGVALKKIHFLTLLRIVLDSQLKVFNRSASGLLRNFL